jgi:hypothetical protein
MDNGAFFRGCEAPGLDIRRSVDRLGTHFTKSYMEYIVFTSTCLSYVRVIIPFMCVSLVELPDGDGTDPSTQV